MSKHHLQNLRQSFFGKPRKSRSANRGRGHGRSLNMESLESRQMMSATPLQTISVSANAGEKPQSKIFEYGGTFWTVMPNKQGTWVFRLDGTNWTQTQKISASKSTHADVKVVGDLAYVLLYEGAKSQFATLQYDSIDNQFEAWASQPNLVNIPLSKGVETATIEADSTGRLWIASDAKTTIEVRYSDGDHSTWSGPITIASGIKSDDISTIIAMPNDTIGVFWSNQSTKRFGFKVHQDSDLANVWSGDEIPGSQSALNVGHGMADDHMHAAVASDGTLYVAVKTSYDKNNYPKMGLLVRRPNGVWDDFYGIADAGTRPVIVLDEADNQLIIAHTTKEGGGDIVYNTSPLDVISFSPTKVLIQGKVNNVTTSKVISGNHAVFLADGKSVMFEFDVAPPIVAPVFSATVSSFSATSSPASDPTASDLAFEDPASVNGALFSSQGLEAGANQTVGTTV
jgi:hypothetical protein